MLQYLVLFQALLAASQARPHENHEELFSELYENDANLNPGFNIDDFRTDQLNLHNHYRALHGVPAMTVDAGLTQQAQQYAETLAARNGGLIHCNKPGCDRHGAGENLARAWGGTHAETNATKAWYEEVWDYNYCHAQDGTFNRPGHEGKAIGHFTQVIWKDSVKLGIGYARTADRTGVYVVGRYKVHGNVQGQYGTQVPKANYLFNTFQNNCDGTNGSFSAWSTGECSRACGGGIRFKTRTCTNPKPSLNGRDCAGKPQEPVTTEWCNIEPCSGDKSFRDLQCEARGYIAKSHIVSSNECQLYCLRVNSNVYYGIGNVDDSTHCNSDSGVCVNGVCISMPKYQPPTKPPPTGGITGSYTSAPSSNIWNNIILTIPIGAKDVVITNKKYNNVAISVGYKTGGSLGYKWSEGSWMNSWVDYYGSYETQFTEAGVTCEYKRLPSYSTIIVAGPVRPTSGYHLALFVQGNSPAQISWSYSF